METLTLGPVIGAGISVSSRDVGISVFNSRVTIMRPDIEPKIAQSDAKKSFAGPFMPYSTTIALKNSKILVFKEPFTSSLILHAYPVRTFGNSSSVEVGESGLQPTSLAALSTNSTAFAASVALLRTTMQLPQSITRLTSCNNTRNIVNCQKIHSIISPHRKF
jgi:hypothetical protein